MPMSAARPEPGDLPPTGGAGAGAEVIPMYPRRGDRVPEQPDGPSNRDPQRELAATVESLALARGQTLTRPDTAAAYRVGVEAFLLILEAAFATGVVDADQHATLLGMAEGLDRVPDSL